MFDFIYVTFPASGVETWVFLPPLVAFIVSFFTSMGGVSGAFVLLPFQMSVLNYTAPSVSGTNQLFNIVAIPSGVWRYVKEQRMVWPLTWAVIIGTLPGVFIGAWVRIEYLPDPKSFKFFAALVLGYVGVRLLTDVLKRKKERTGVINKKPSEHSSGLIVTDTRFSFKRVEFKFGGEQFSFSVPGVLLLCLIVGIVGGIYGIGGGAIIAPFFIAFFHLPVYTVAGAALMGTFVTSVAGVAIYHVLALFYPNVSVAPDWFLGSLFGIGGFFGMYLGARCQKYVPAHMIKLILCACVLFVAGKYVWDFLGYGLFSDFFCYCYSLEGTNYYSPGLRPGKMNSSLALIGRIKIS
ncbi:MAG: sulfite exporter TauE/SafE family protein, partial [bacterium]|nr:sulfite exporter TauE/SafE family protein [bacterium]